MSDERRFRRMVLLLAAAIGVFAFLTRPQTNWEMDELLFQMGIEQFEPLRHHPHPPGYPLLIGLGKLLLIFSGDPFDALRLLSILSVTIGFAALAFAIRNLTGSYCVAVVGSLLFHLSPGMIVHGPMPMSDPPAIMFLELALWSVSDPGRLDVRRLTLFGLFASASIGCRPQYAVPIVPTLLLALFLAKDLRARLAAVIAFGLTSLAWIAPLVAASGGLSGFMGWQSAQASWVAQVDAGVARHSHSIADLIKRFVFHPWGPKEMSLPVLLLAAAGAAHGLRERVKPFLPILTIASIHLVFTTIVCDPADGVRYVLPAHIATAVFGAIGLWWLAGSLERLRLPTSTLALTAFVLASVLYTWPVVSLRTTTDAPPWQAIEWIREREGTDLLVLYDGSMTPHSQAFLDEIDARPFEHHEELVRREGPIMLLGEGRSAATDAINLEWPDSDAYGKLTRNHYRIVSVDPLLENERFLPVRGIGTWQSSDAKLRWRWIEESAVLTLPPCCGDLRLLLSLPSDAPLERVRLRFATESGQLGTTTLERGSMKRLRIPLPPDASQLRIDTSDAYRPADAPPSAPPVAAKLLDLRRQP